MHRPNLDKLAAKAVSERRNTRTAPPSARTNPPAPSENARQSPVGYTMDACENEINDVGAEIILMPAVELRQMTSPLLASRTTPRFRLHDRDQIILTTR